MNYTSNHHLPQWVSSDRVRMSDFNAAMANIESGLVSASSAASRAQSTANAAQSAANTAKSTADAAQSAASAAYSPAYKPYVVGSYVGDGKVTQIVRLQFESSFVIISGATENTDANDYTNIVPYFAITADSQNVRRRVQLLPNGFAAYSTENYDKQLPNLNEEGRSYDYIAFR